MRVDRLRRDRDIGLAIHVLAHELVVVHAVEMIARENQVVVRVEAREVPLRLADGVRRPLIPVRIVGRLLGREDLDEPVTEQIHPI